MRFRSLAFGLLACLTSASPLVAQENLADLLADPAVNLNRPADRARVAAQMGRIESARHRNARDRAALQGLPVRRELPNGRIQEIADFRPDGRPLYRITENVNAAISTGANLLRTSPYSLNGSGITIGLWDGGSARSTHQEFGGRVSVMDGAASIDHATHVGGTLIATGIDAAARGMANGATVDSYDWNSDVAEMTSRGATVAGDPGKIYLSNHSYGFISGWNQVNAGTPTRVWEWYGSGTTSTSIESDFGVYNTSARDSDSLAFNAPYYLVFRSAGNDRIDNPTTGQTVALVAGSTSVVSYDPALHPAGDGNYRGGFDTIGFNALAKNVITVGSVLDAVTTGTRDPAKATVSSFSSWGPTDDGRIKPDVVANGHELYSSLNGSDTSYGIYSGTSMATPNAVGSSALLIQHYGNLFPGQAMRASTLKGLLIHTATDIGNPGPDYKYGWGLVDVQAAAALLSDHLNFPEKIRLTENQLTTATTTRTHSFVWDGVSPISATLCWTDPAGTATTTSDSRTARLINNLNLKIIAPGGAEYLPFVMPFVGTWTQASMDSAATTGINNTDNIEQVRIATPPVAGTYQVQVSFSGSLTNASQNYSLLVSGSYAPTPTPPGTPTNLIATPGNNNVKLTWSGSLGATTYQVKRSLTAGGPYTQIATTANTTHTDSSAVNGTNYYYVVSASNASGTSADTAEVHCVPNATASTTTLASSSGTTGPYGTAVTFTATVSGATATGSVTFKDGATVLGTTTLNASAQAVFNTSTLSLGGHSITATYAGDSTFAPSISGTFNYMVSPKPVTITGVAATGKVYDGTTTAVLTGGTVSGVVVGETVNVVPGSGAFTSPNAGLQSVATTGYAITGTHAGNYVLSAQPAASGTITPRPLQVSGSRIYDGTATAAAGVLTITNNLDGANLSLTGTATLTGRNTGTQTLTSGATAARIQSTVGNTGTTARTSFTVTMGTTPVSGNTLIAVISTRGTSAGRVTGISQTGAVWSRAAEATNTNGSTTEIWFAPGVTGAGTVVTINQASLRSAAIVIEYSGVLTTDTLDLNSAATGSGTSPSTGTTATTTQNSELWIGGIGYAGSSPTLGSITNGFNSVVSSQSTSNSSGNNAKVYALESFVNASAAASSGGTLSATAQWSGAIATFKTSSPSTLAPSGPAAGNYTATGAGGSVVISPKSIIWGGIAAASRNYDGTSVATLTGSAALQASEVPGSGNNSDGKPYTGDLVSLNGTATATFANKHAGNSKPVTVTGITLGGAQAGNYSLTPLTGLTANVLPRPLTIAAVNASKTYDGTTTAAGTPTLTPALAAGDTTTPLYQEFQDSAAGTGNRTIIPHFTINDGNSGNNYAVTAVNWTTGSILPVSASIVLGNLSATYDGTARSVTTTTTPPGLDVAITYDGSPTPPTGAGTHAVLATIVTPNYQGTATGNLVIAKAAATISLAGLEHIYDGTPKSATGTTTPQGLGVSLTYDNSPTAPTDVGNHSVSAVINDPNYQGSASGILHIAKADASITLTGLLQTYDGTPKAINVITSPESLEVDVTYNGTAVAPTLAGSYAVVVTVNEPNYQGTASGTLVIGKAAAEVFLAGLETTYDGTPRTVTATTAPAGLGLAVTYGRSQSPPSGAGTYQVVATVIDPNYEGSATGSLHVAKANASVSLGGLEQTYDGTPKAVSTSTTPGGLGVDITYNGSSNIPVNAGTYAVSAVVNDPNYQGTQTGSLVIQGGSNSWDSWSAGNFTPSEQTAGIAADDADPDADGLSNLAEYALGADPKHFTPPMSAVVDANGLSLTFTRPAGLPGMTYSAEASDGLGTWNPIQLEVLETGAIETVRARDPLTTGNPARRFIRLRFERATAP